MCLHLPVPGFGPHPLRFSDQLLWSCHHKRINILRHSRRFFRCACKALLPAAP
ncbi:hypothetical protein NG03_004779, partial [Salmonella enterica subsp. enterica]|nr:hypothetical protein [Salmonella enterica subsp. enterica]